MKRNLLVALAMVFSASAYSQFYVAVSGGYGFEANPKVLGKEVNKTGVNELKGSYGAGFQSQIRGGYFFTKRIGAEVAVGYLHGKELQTYSVSNGVGLDITAQGRAFGASLAAIYNVTKNIYVRAGVVTKIGGKTEVFTSFDLPVPKHHAKAEIKNNLHGKIPFGFIGGLGYKFKLTDKVSAFIEGEYLNINVGRKTSKLDSFSATYNGKAISKEVFANSLKGFAGSNPALAPIADQLTPLLQEEYDWSDKNAPDAPYSSVGVNVGLIFHL
ncbi:outer membrane beta-barrel protein [Capnocytophaga canimorsus]|uniref:outer membrane beta-barrel protein n=1 Tax=Capnocytophaga canimorsus TaxID=28188 RepID=UPI0028ED840E|nr:outer membrane beta-barrel protein [Capnocytophaga canimorsus]MDT9499284.1 porin family protein [Capnocytophaga canimorsus]